MRHTVLTALVIAAAWCAPASATAQTTALFLDSQPGDPFGNGTQRTYTLANATIAPDPFVATGIYFSVDARDFSSWWNLEFRAPDGAQLQVGSYVGPGGSSYEFGGLSIAGNGTGCTNTGRFVVREIAYNGNGTVQRLAIDFEQHCDDRDPALFGALRYNSTIASLVPFDGVYPTYRFHVEPKPNGVVTGAGLTCGHGGGICDATFAAPAMATITATPDPGFFFAGWTSPCHGSRSITVHVNTDKTCTALFRPVTPSKPSTVTMLTSQRGNGTDPESREVYNTDNSRLPFRLFDGGTGFFLLMPVVDDGDTGNWWFFVYAPIGQLLAPGTYANAGLFPTPAAGGLDVIGRGSACSNGNSIFTVHEFVIANRTIARLAIDFEYHCVLGTTTQPPVMGSIRYNSLVPPRPALAVGVPSSDHYVALSPSGRVCGADCVEAHDAADIVALTPIPSHGWVFTGWRGDEDCVDGVVTMSAPAACEATFAVAVDPASITPNAGSGATQVFTLAYTDSLSALDLVAARVRFRGTNTASGNCTIAYNATTGVVTLLNDNGFTGQSGVFGTARVLEKNECALNLATSSASASGTTLTLTLAITFRPSFRGLKNIHMRADSATGSTSGWVQRGTWTPAPDVGPVAVAAISVSPSAGSGARQVFALQYSDTYSALDLHYAEVRIASSNVVPGTCSLRYDPWKAQVWFALDSGTTWRLATLGTNATLSNSQCTLYLATSSASLSGDILNLTLDLEFAPAYNGQKNIYMLAAASNGTNTGWTPKGTWAPYPGPSVVDAVSVAPNTGTGLNQTFTLHYSDSNGAGDLASVRLRIGTSNAGPGTCSAWYDPAAATIKLTDNAGTWGAPVPIGSGTLSNSQCTLNLGSSSATPSGTDLTLVLSITFSSSFAGSKNVYMMATSVAGSGTGWILRGGWTPIPSGAPAVVDAVSASPGNGAGTTGQLTLQFTDSLGASDLTSARVRIASTNVGPGTCTVWYNAATATIKLMDDAGVWGAPVPLGAGTLSNSQCTVNLWGTTATVTGNTLTLLLNVSFTPSFVGSKNIYMMAGSAGGVGSGWLTKGTWFVTSPSLSVP